METAIERTNLSEEPSPVSPRSTGHPSQESMLKYHNPQSVEVGLIVNIAGNAARTSAEIALEKCRER